jgi:hypothetical protein
VHGLLKNDRAMWLREIDRSGCFQQPMVAGLIVATTSAQSWARGRALSENFTVSQWGEGVLALCA